MVSDSAYANSHKPFASFFFSFFGLKNKRKTRKHTHHHYHHQAFILMNWGRLCEFNISIQSDSEGSYQLN